MAYDAKTDVRLSSFFIMTRSRFDNTLNFDITLTPNGHVCVVIRLDKSVMLQSLFAFTLVCQIKESLKHGSTTKDSITQAGCSRHSQVADTV